MSDERKVVVGRRPKASVKDAGYGTFNVRIPLVFREDCARGAAGAGKSLGRWLGELARKASASGEGGR